MEEEISVMFSMERTSSIDKEPRTLSIDRLQFAREAAEYVINTRSVEEARIIFTKGLVPVTNCYNNNDQDKTSMEFDKEEEGEEPKYCRNLLRIAEPRDIASAPF